MQQLKINWEGRGHRDDLWQRMLEHLKRIRNEATPKEMAYRCDVAVSSLSHALSKRNGYAIHMEWFLDFMFSDDHDQMLAWLADLRGYELVKKKPLDAESKLEKLEDALERSLGPDLIKAIKRQAFGEDLP